MCEMNHFYLETDPRTNTKVPKPRKIVIDWAGSKEPEDITAEYSFGLEIKDIFAELDGEEFEALRTSPPHLPVPSV
jgi:hypothetical protein